MGQEDEFKNQTEREGALMAEVRRLSAELTAAKAVELRVRRILARYGGSAAGCNPQLLLDNITIATIGKVDV